MTEKGAKNKLASVLCCFAGAGEQGMQGIRPTQMSPHLSSRRMTLIFSCDCPKDSYPFIALEHPFGLISTSPHRSWEQCGVVTVSGGRRVSVSLNLVYPCKWGLISSYWKINQKSHLEYLLPCIPVNPRTRSLPMNPGCQPKNVRFSGPLKGGPLYRIPS